MDKPIVSHVGIAVANLEEAVKRYSLITGDPSPEICDVAEQKVKVAIFKSAHSADASGGRIELVSPISDDSPVAKFISKHGEGLHHVCIYVEDIRQKLAELKQAGVRLIDETPRVGAEGNLIAFVHPTGMNGVLIELEQIIRK